MILLEKELYSCSFLKEVDDDEKEGKENFWSTIKIGAPKSKSTYCSLFYGWTKEMIDEKSWFLCSWCFD